MNRRNFLKFLGGAAAAAVVAPEATKAFFFAPRGGWQKEGSIFRGYIEGIPYYQNVSVPPPFGICLDCGQWPWTVASVEPGGKAGAYQEDGGKFIQGVGSIRV